jgi:hypothetical protein
MKNTFKVIIAGSRSFTYYNLLRDKCNYLLQNKENIEIVSGGAKGADSLAQMYAEENDFPFTCFPVTKEDWKEKGKAAGPLRNKDMSDYSDAAILFWDSKSRGTFNMWNLMKAVKKPCRIVRFDPDEMPL